MEFLDESARPAALSISGVEERWYHKTGVIVLTFLAIPPLAIPMVWLHPKLRVTWKVGITLLIGVLCWGTYWTSMLLLVQLEALKKMLEDLQI